MGWLALARALVALAAALIAHAGRRGGADPLAEDCARRMEEMIRAVDLARAARRAAVRSLDDPDRLRADDGHRRD
ncbi:hypothetical protein [Prosthecodimorpha staleyi]|uniref:Uncharacterized protein n=1 Tax=Prosthecodimorpha staleyi TaxID=2840188 RepID=A0A947D951_9HYPH|nr:hypothetical protein [Prosthecodimorpha staleyi]MBT9289109.1 hypothetical protein [Prosthecodimorpha staleyi]